MVHCFACACNPHGRLLNSDNPRRSYFRFPKNEKRCKIWLEAIGGPLLPKYTAQYCYNNLRLCSLHFEARWFANDKHTRLDEFAIPTLFSKEIQHNSVTEEVLNKPGTSQSAVVKFPQNLNNVKIFKDFAAFKNFMSSTGDKRTVIPTGLPNIAEETVKSRILVKDEEFLKEENQTESNKQEEFEEIYIKTEKIDEFEGNENSAEPSNKRLKLQGESDELPDSKDENRLQRIIRLLEDKLANIILENDQLKAENEKLKKENDELKFSQTSLQTKINKIFTSGQVKAMLNPEKMKEWNTQDITTALILESISPKAYRYLSTVRKMPLPSVPILRKWVATSSFDFCEINRMIKAIQRKCESFSDQTMLTVLCLQKIKFGEENYQLIMARGLFKAWSQPVFCAYGTMNQGILLVIIKELFSVGFTVVGIVYEPSLIYSNVFDGLNYLKRCWFEHPVDKDLKIFGFVDSHYILNLLHNHFLYSGFDINEYKIDKSIIKKILDIKSFDLKISEKHITNRSSHGTKLAEELFSTNVSDALISCGQVGLLGNLPWPQAAEVIKIIRDWFNMFQRDVCDGYGYDLDSQNAILQNTTKFVKKLKVCGTGMNDCRKAIVRNNGSLQEFYGYLQTKYKYTDQHIPTRHLSNDVINDFMSYVRPLEQNEDYQDALMVKSRFKDYVIGRVLSMECDSDNSYVSSVKLSSGTKCTEENKSVGKLELELFEEITIKTEVDPFENL